MQRAVLILFAAVFLSAGAVHAQEKEKADLASVFSRFPVKFYGYLKLDLAWDDSRVSTGNFARWVEDETNTEDDSETNVTANQSRFGFDIGGPESEDYKTGGKFEIDFYGGGPGENKANPRMRHAYLWLECKETKMKVLAGQTWDLVGYLNFAKTLNFYGGWMAGNIGYRHPQLRLQKTWDMPEDRCLVGAVALSRTIGDATGNPPFSPGDTGEDADIPTIQARLGLHMPLLAGRAMFALSGHFGTEEYDTAVGDQSEDFDSWSVCLDFNLPLHKNVLVNGCLFTGENLDDYYGGIGQGVNTTALTEIASQGGFINVCLCDLVPKWHFNIGASMEDPDNDDLGAGDRAKNMNIYGNAKYWIMKDLMAGVELGIWETEYIGADDADAFRVQFAMQYWF